MELIKMYKKIVKTEIKKLSNLFAGMNPDAIIEKKNFIRLTILNLDAILIQAATDFIEKHNPTEAEIENIYRINNQSMTFLFKKINLPPTTAL